MIPSTIANHKQAASAQIAIAIGHLKAAMHLWSPGTGLSPNEERSSGEVARWHKLHSLIEQLEVFDHNEGPGA